MSAFVFSDPHFYHENMAKKRNFSSAEEMNEHIIKKWNQVVSKRDGVYLLGDITMEKKKYEILSRLNGIINVVLGNHDQRQHVREMLEYVNGVAGMIDYKGKVILSHCPIHPSQLEFRYGVNIHGHVHENTLEDSRYINVSAEVIDYTPVEIIKLVPWLNL
jgi:calcineurin-like phosphoesterase family protein